MPGMLDIPDISGSSAKALDALKYDVRYNIYRLMMTLISIHFSPSMTRPNAPIIKN